VGKERRIHLVEHDRDVERVVGDTIVVAARIEREERAKPECAGGKQQGWLERP